MLHYPLALALLADPAEKRWQIVLADGVLNRRDQIRSLSRQMPSTMEQITGGPPLSRVGIGLRDQTAL
ncbi:MAG: hypothetical protein ACREX4_23760 [Gammaproteobacteria bacterium]